MNNTGYDENDNDRFKCPECDFKSSSENYIIEHSAMHECQNNVTDSLLDIIENDSMEIETAVGFLSKFISINEIESCSRFKDRPDIITCDSNIDNEYKHIDIAENTQDNLNMKKTVVACVKREYVPDINCHESYLFEEIFTDETYYENENGNKKLKVENIQIEHTFIPDNRKKTIEACIKREYVPDINDHDNNHVVKTESYLFEEISTDETYHENENNKLNIQIEHNYSQSLTPWEITSARTPHMEIEVDNTGIYIPPGWNRKLYMKTGLYNGHRIKYDCCYYTELGKKIRRKENALHYRIRNPSAIEKLDIEKLNFSTHQRMNIDQPNLAKLEVDVDNTGIYIPDGWQRKINMSKNPNAEIKYRIIYISTEGKRFWCKPEVYLHIFRSNRIKDKYIDLEKMNFTVTQSCLNEKECKYKTNKIKNMPILDNTGVYIPEGWQRILNAKKSSNGRKYCCINYITPEGKVMQMKSMVYTYLSQSDKLEDKYIDVEKMTFSVRSARLPVLDNTGIYIPDGWQRKLYKNIHSTERNKVSIFYVTPEGKKLWSKQKTNRYLSNPDRLAEKHIHVAKFDFSMGIKFSRTRRYHNNTEKDKVFGYLFDVRKIIHKTSTKSLYLCRLCKNINKFKSNANIHINEHIQRIHNELTACNSLPNRYDYFVCTECHGKIMRSKDIQTHLLSHNSEQISSNIFGVRCKYIRNYVKNVVHCCEICNFACIKYIDIFKHLKVHTLDEINSTDRDRYHTLTNVIDENVLYSLHIDGDLGDNVAIDNLDMSGSKIDKSRSKKRARGPLQEIEVDNTGKYIPNGWQRKVFHNIYGKSTGKYKVSYISPFGQSLYTSAEVSAHIEWLEGEGIKEPVDVKKFDFSWYSHNLPTVGFCLIFK
ncbi:unnamed protein product [Meganyctiphanes norvegica]|uniref:C2H2-type domain-containing protein n=1 Tax=Meganyctiphanes norvegica TaxID=48144 RepID=A0AAV2SR98_MEGNR